MSKAEIKVMNIEKETPVRFKPRARLLLQLGDQLIKNESIALVELVKNSYDADANIVNIYMENVDEPEKGIIIIEDDGFGMSPETVENVWLEPGADFKSIQVKQNKLSPKFKRLPIGEKGIGRFGVHKLGGTIELTTRAKNNNEVFVKIDWSDFDNYTYLNDVPIKIIERKVPKIYLGNKTGTTILISNLRKKWERGIAREVKRSITALASPFEENGSFKPSFEIIDKPGWFDGLLDWRDVHEFALFKFKAVLEGTEIIEFQYDFTPWPSMTKLRPKSVLLDDNYISTFKTLKYSDDEGAEHVINLNNNKIGRITFEGYVFDQDPYLLKMGVSDKDGFKKYLKSNGGVRVFRDKLRVYDYGEPENDWLGLDYRRFQQPAKRISNNNILSAVSLNRETSSDLIEKTNREGFVENAAYHDLRNSLLHVIELVETLKGIDKKKVRELYGPTPKSSPVMSTLSEAKKYVEEKVRENEVKQQIIKYFNKIESDYKTISENLLKAAGAGLSMSVVVHEVEKIIYEVEKILKSEKASERVLNLVKHLSSLIDGYAEIIRKSSKTNENLVQIVDQALFNTEYRLESHKIEIIKAYKNFKGKCKINVAKNLLIGTLMNLIDNSIFWLDQRAINYIDKKAKFKKKILIDIADEDKYINLIISDNGTGFLIPTDDITEPFVTAKPGGMGLGLHIAYEIMESQQGKLIFPDKGEFEIPDEYADGATVVLSFKK
ncbi:MAG: ATP-binding protein [Chitinophagaceae bacterium]|nr:ATP-binding protein [Chitinophagaceae bacterium]